MSTYLVAPSINQPTVTINGQRIPHEDRLNKVAIGGFVVIGILLVIFIFFYFSPLFRERPARLKSKESNARTAAGSDTEAGADMDPADKSTLLAWMHRRSRGRFVDITGSTPHPSPQIPYPPKLEPRSRGTRVNSFFSRISAVPNLVFPSLPPAVFSAPSDSPSQTPTKRPFFPAYNLSFRSKSVLSISEEVTPNTRPNGASMMGVGYPIDNTTNISGCRSDNSLYPSWIPRIPSPSRAILIDKAPDGSLTRNKVTSLVMSEVKTESGVIQPQFPNARPRMAGESDPF